MADVYFSVVLTELWLVIDEGTGFNLFDDTGLVIDVSDRILYWLVVFNTIEKQKFE